MGGGPVGSDVVGWSVQGHEVLDAQASSKLTNRFVVATTDQCQLDVDTGLPGNSDSLDCDVLSLGLSEPTDKTARMRSPDCRSGGVPGGASMTG